MPSTQKRCERCGASYTDNSPNQRGKFCRRSCRERAAREREAGLKVPPTKATATPKLEGSGQGWSPRDNDFQRMLSSANIEEVESFFRSLPDDVTLHYLTCRPGQLAGRLTNLSEQSRARVLSIRGLQPEQCFWDWVEMTNAETDFVPPSGVSCGDPSCRALLASEAGRPN